MEHENKMINDLTITPLDRAKQKVTKERADVDQSLSAICAHQHHTNITYNKLQEAKAIKKKDLIKMYKKQLKQQKSQLELLHSTLIMEVHQWAFAVNELNQMIAMEVR